MPWANRNTERQTETEKGLLKQEREREKIYPVCILKYLSTIARTRDTQRLNH